MLPIFWIPEMDFRQVVCPEFKFEKQEIQAPELKKDQITKGTRNNGNLSVIAQEQQNNNFSTPIFFQVAVLMWQTNLCSTKCVRLCRNLKNAYT